MQLTQREGKHYTYRKLEFWAHCGLIKIIDYRKEPPDFKTELLRTFLLRAQDMIRERDRCRYADERKELQDCIEHMVLCAREAKQQGDPADPAVQEHVRKHHTGPRLLMPTPAFTAEINRPRPLTNRGV